MSKKLNFRQILAVVLGNLILGLGVALLRVSQTGNDPYTALAMALSDGFGIGLGNFLLGVNLVLLIVEVSVGRKYLGLGSVINLFLLGYVVQYASQAMSLVLGDGSDFSLPKQLILMAAAMVVVTFGLSMYQVADMGVAPYDYLALGLSDHSKRPYFMNRMLTDGICVLIIIITCLAGFLSWENSHLGIGTVVAAFCLGPLVNAFNRLHRKWVWTKKP